MLFIYTAIFSSLFSFCSLAFHTPFGPGLPFEIAFLEGVTGRCKSVCCEEIHNVVGETGLIYMEYRVLQRLCAFGMLSWDRSIQPSNSWMKLRNTLNFENSYIFYLCFQISNGSTIKVFKRIANFTSGNQYNIVNLLFSPSFIKCRFLPLRYIVKKMRLSCCYVILRKWRKAISICFWS